MAVATVPILAHKHLQHMAPDLPGLSCAAASSRMYQDPRDSHRQAFNHSLTDQLFHKPLPSSHTFTSTYHRCRRKPHQPRSRHRRSPATLTADAEDDRALAADPDVYLPGAGARHWSPNFQTTKQQTPPLLERAEAFRSPPRCLELADFVADDADLYRLGLLYHDDDDEHTRGGGGREKKTTTTTMGSEDEDEERAPPDLSSREEAALAVHVHEMAREGGEEEEDAVVVVDGGVASRRGGRREREEKEKEKSVVSPLEVIRELPEGSSSPGPEAPADGDASSLWLSDAEEKEEDGHDWAFLDKAEAMEMEVEAEVEVEVSCPADAEVDASTDADDSGAMPATGDPWIMLGDDS
ncbi:hypothetical protein F5X96DRAFT_645977 [Biscogniauxia mediterranea]|nr:hypothetical protein F5X96DRAFT_645977 [Biscogniauxia mediterranea]